MTTAHPLLPLSLPDILLLGHHQVPSPTTAALEPVHGSVGILIRVFVQVAKQVPLQSVYFKELGLFSFVVKLVFGLALVVEGIVSVALFVLAFALVGVLVLLALVIKHFLLLFLDALVPRIFLRLFIVPLHLPAQLYDAFTGDHSLSDVIVQAEGLDGDACVGEQVLFPPLHSELLHCFVEASLEVLVNIGLIVEASAVVVGAVGFAFLACRFKEVRVAFIDNAMVISITLIL